jgi:hypothetical protein
MHSTFIAIDTQLSHITSWEVVLTMGGIKKMDLQMQCEKLRVKRQKRPMPIKCAI